MDIQKEKHNYLAMLVAEDAITQEQCSNLSLYNGGNYFHSDFLASSKVDCINWGWSAWKEAKTQAVPEGFLLMPRKCTNKMAHAAKAVDGRLSVFKYADVYDAMIEAREPAND